MTTLSRVLVVEDEVLTLLALVDDLADRQIEAVPVTSATRALGLLGNIDALVTDIELPGGYDGMQLARLAARQHPGLPIVVVSGGVRPGAGQLPQGAAFIPKPYSVNDILSALERQVVAHAA